MKGRENPSATVPPLMGHTNVPWVPGMCNGIGRQIMWVTDCENEPSRFKNCVKKTGKTQVPRNRGSWATHTFPGCLPSIVPSTSRPWGSPTSGYVSDLHNGLVRFGGDARRRSVWLINASHGLTCDGHGINVRRAI